MRVAVDRDRCCASGNCVIVAPDVFGQHEDTGIVVLLKAVVADSDRDAVREAEWLCPAAAITLIER